MGKCTNIYVMPTIMGIYFYIYTKYVVMKPKEISPEHRELLQELGIRLKKLRTAKKISYIELAKEIGISRNAYNLIENGNVYFNFNTVLLILKYHNIKLSELFEDL